jgi:hypothetical protein
MEPKTWLVDSGASKHMKGYKEILSNFKTKYFVEQVELGDEKCYKIEGVGSISFRFESRARLHVDEVMFQDSRRIFYQLQPLRTRDIG